MTDKYATFASLHRPGDPVILYNVWDVGSARAVAGAGAQALATGSHPVADAQGWPDGERVPIEFAIANAERIAASVDVPLSVDFEGAYSIDPAEAAENVLRLKQAGAVGCNFEDQIIGGDGLHDLDSQCARIRAIRQAVGEDFFINARTDLYLKSKEHDETLANFAIQRGKAFADAGASGFFVPRLAEARQVEMVVEAVPLPLNLIAFPGAPAVSEWAALGVARVSYGPFPHRELMEKLGQMARAALHFRDR